MGRKLITKVCAAEALYVCKKNKLTEWAEERKTVSILVVHLHNSFQHVGHILNEAEISMKNKTET